MIQKRQVKSYSKGFSPSENNATSPNNLFKLSALKFYRKPLLYFILVISLGYLAWIITTLVWLDSFWALPIYKEKTLIGIKQEQTLLMLPYRRALDVIFSEKEIPENLSPYKKSRFDDPSQQLCIKLSIDALKIKKACKPVRRLSIFEKAMCANKIVVKSCKLKKLDSNGKYIYLTEEGLKSYDK